MVDVVEKVLWGLILEVEFFIDDLMLIKFICEGVDIIDFEGVKILDWVGVDLLDCKDSVFFVGIECKKVLMMVVILVCEVLEWEMDFMIVRDYCMVVGENVWEGEYCFVYICVLVGKNFEWDKYFVFNCCYFFW